MKSTVFLHISWLYAALFLLFFVSATLARPANIPLADNTTDPQETIDNALDKGLTLKNQGEWQKALDVWLQAWHSTEQGHADPRIGIEFINLVTLQEADNFYSVASQIYKWGFSGNEIQLFKDYLHREIQYIKPLLSEETYTTWEAYLDDDDPELLREISRFWIDRDPAPNSDMNERLIEHWERIQYSKKHFNRETTTPYNTDDRGIIFIKYGKPDDQKAGDFQPRYGDINQWAREFLREQNVDMTENFQSVSGGSESFHKWISNEELKDNITQSITDQALMRNQLSDYEVWIYEDIENHSRENLIFLFGEAAGSSTFSIIEAPEAFIPTNAFMERSHTGQHASYNYGPLYQLSIYKDLRLIDDFFLDRFNHMENFLYMDDEAMYKENTSQKLKEQNRRRFNRIQNRAPETSSVYNKHLANFELGVHSYRFFDEEKNPYILFFTYTEASEIVITDHYELIANNPNAESEYLLRHSLSVRDHDYDIIHSNHNTPRLEIFEEQQLNHLMQPSSTFLVQTSPENIRRIDFTGEIFNHNRDKYIEVDEPNYRLSEKLVATGKNRVLMDTIPALSKDELEISDILMGFGEDDDLSNAQAATLSQHHKVPFYTPPQPVIPHGTDVELLFDVYNLTSGEDTYNTFTLDYRVRQVDSGNWFTDLFRSEDDRIETSLTLNYEIAETSTREHLTIDASSFDPGKYELELVVTDQMSNEKVKRTQSFEIIDINELAQLD